MEPTEVLTLQGSTGIVMFLALAKVEPVKQPPVEKTVMPVKTVPVPTISLMTQLKLEAMELEVRLSAGRFIGKFTGKKRSR